MLKSLNGDGRIIAGGTDLILDLRKNKFVVNSLIDITRIDSLKNIEFTENKINKITIGALVTHTKVAESQLIRDKASLLAKAANSVGCKQIRNVGTVVGNVVSALPAADVAVALIALEAEAEVIGPGGSNTVLVEDLYERLFTSKVDSNSQLVTKIKFNALREKQGSAYVRMTHRKALALPILNAAAVVSISNGVFDWVKIVVAPTTEIPSICKEVDKVLAGVQVNNEALSEAAEFLSNNAVLVEDIRANKEYRKKMIQVVAKRALEEAVAAAS